MMSSKTAAIIAAITVGVTACTPVELIVPSADEVESVYQVQSQLGVEMKGNVAEITVAQSRAQLRRGGGLWAKVGPQVFLFSDETKSLFDQYNGLAGVRVITTSGGREVARALLLRNELNEVTWQRALNIAGIARRDGSRHPSTIEKLVLWGEDHTEFTYNSAFVPR